MFLFHWLFFENIITSCIIEIMENVFKNDQIKYENNIFFQSPSLPKYHIYRYSKTLNKVACFTLMMVLDKERQKRFLNGCNILL